MFRMMPSPTPGKAEALPNSPQGQGGPPPELLAALAAAQQQGGPPPPDGGDAPPAPQDDKLSPKYDVDKVSKDIAKYLDPNCRCNNCQFFQGQNACHIVQGPIDPQGVCSLHTCSDDKGQDDDSDPNAPPPDQGGDAPPDEMA